MHRGKHSVAVKVVFLTVIFPILTEDRWLKKTDLLTLKLLRGFSLFEKNSCLFNDTKACKKTKVIDRKKVISRFAKIYCYLFHSSQVPVQEKSKRMYLIGMQLDEINMFEVVNSYWTHEVKVKWRSNEILAVPLSVFQFACCLAFFSGTACRRVWYFCLKLRCHLT